MALTLAHRLRFDADADFVRLYQCFGAGQFAILDVAMLEHFAVAKARPKGFQNHPTVFGISMGGTNTKLILASMRDGLMHIEYVKALANPPQPTSFEAFVDNVVLADPPVRQYLRTHPSPVVGVSLPVALLGGVPFHPSKIPTITGFIARTKDQVCDGLKFDDHFGRILARHGLRPRLYFNSDGPIAHHGAVSISPVDPRDKTILLVCGTGLATSDERAFVVTGQAPLLDGDEELFPADQTDGHQYQFLVAGKGLFGLMSRAIAIRAREAGSTLGGCDLTPHFAAPRDTKTVVEIWESTLDGAPAGAAAAIAQQVGPAAFGELQAIAAALMPRAIATLANCAVSTIAAAGRAPNGLGHRLYFEGSIAKSRCIFPRLKEQILQRIGNAELFHRLGVQQPLEPRMQDPRIEVSFDPAVAPAARAEVDYTLIGAASAAMANALCRTQLT